MATFVCSSDDGAGDGGDNARATPSDASVAPRRRRYVMFFLSNFYCAIFQYDFFASKHKLFRGPMATFVCLLQ